MSNKKNTGINNNSNERASPSHSSASSSSASGLAKKKTGLISSLYQSSQTRQNQTENDLIYKYQNNIPITPEDVLKLNRFTESKLSKIDY